MSNILHSILSPYMFFSVSYIIHNPRMEWMTILDLLELFLKFPWLAFIFWCFIYIELINFILTSTC